MQDLVIIHTDGSCEPNPGPGGWSAILQYKETTKEIFGYHKESTNNRMELIGVMESLRSLKRPINVKVYSDSQYVVKGIGKWDKGEAVDGWIKGWKERGWRRKEGVLLNDDLWKELYPILGHHVSISMHWVKGHVGNVLNERCDELASIARKRQESSS